MIPDHDDDMTRWRHLSWPDESLVISELLSDESHQTRHPDTITTHHDIPRLTISVLILEAEHIREPGPQLEYIGRLRYNPTITDRMSTLDTDEAILIYDFFVMGLSAF